MKFSKVVLSVCLIILVAVSTAVNPVVATTPITPTDPVPTPTQAPVTPVDTDVTPTPSVAPEPTSTPTSVPTPTDIPVPTNTPTQAPQPTSTPTSVPSPTESPEPTNTPTHVPQPTATPSVVEDDEIPTFGNCAALLANPGDHASYDEGIHGVVGVGNFSGADDVYSQGAGNFVQCFCSLSETGIQSDWLNAGDMSQDEIDAYIADGWFYEARGEDWNLDADPYLVRNTEFSCAEDVIGDNAEPTVTPTPTPTQSQAVGGFVHTNVLAPRSTVVTTPMCTESVNTMYAPELFQIEMSGSTATLYFTPGQMPYNHYDIEYGYASDGVARYATEHYVSDYPYVTVVEIGYLNPNTAYFFRVRAGNGCAGGPWSNALVGTTLSLGVVRKQCYFLYN